MGVVRRTGVRVYRWRAAWREALALRCAAGSDGPGELPDPLDLLGQDQLVVAGMPQPVALVAVADQQFALALEQADAVDLDGLDRGRSFGCVVRAVGRVVRVRLDGEHRSTPSIRVINANDSHFPVQRFPDLPMPSSPRPPPRRHRPPPRPPPPPP